MLYREFKNLKLSALGMGTMRLPVLENGIIDESAAAEMVAYAMSRGVNYYDTAWGYHGGKSETVIGKLLNAYPRDSYYIATKFPGYDLSNMGKVESIFEKQLEKTGMEYFDFYLFHNVCEMNIDEYLAEEKNGTLAYLLRQKELGRIRHLGFSAHGSLDVMKRFLDFCGEHMEFCQLQINWLDWSFQSAKEKAELLANHGIPVWVMEPLRGGKLASVSETDEAKLKALRPEESVPAWAFRFLQTFPNMGVILSGMSNMAQLKENIAVFESENPLSKTELDTLFEIASDMTRGVPCTACRYCVDHCPAELDIPRLIELYNEHSFSGGGFLAPMALSALPKEKHPDACLGCQSCEAVCPQSIGVSGVMTSFANMLKK